MTIRRLFVANRGEIAVRIIRTAQRLGIETVLGVSVADRDSLAARMANRVVVLGPAPAQQSYLDAPRVVHAAAATGCEALHPGYGFLSEKPELARLCEQAGVIFVGPRAETIETLGDKLSARAFAQAAGVAMVPGTALLESLPAAIAAAEKLGFPVVMKASAGGGGKGMFKANSVAELTQNFELAQREAQNAFGDGRLYMERFVTSARHVEVQIVGDGAGEVLHFGERDCTVQRRYQKLIEEAPAAALPANTRQRLHAAAVQLTAEAKYRGAGTVEFLYDIERDAFYFMEVNSRIQVEHPVTEQVTGVDLIALQLRVASGAGLGLTQEQIRVTGHAIECRINAEDPARNFQPSPGRITRWQAPEGAGIRLDTHVSEGYLVPPYYDSMIAKLIVTADDRPAAIQRLQAALAQFQIEGPATTLGLAAQIVAQPQFQANQITTRWLETEVLAPLVRS